MGSAASDRTAGGQDALTGLVSAAGARARLAAGRGGQVAMLIGLQRFQSVNRAYGRRIGDLALVEVARRLRAFADAELDGEWFAARLGGSDFLLAAHGAHGRERWSWLADTLADAIARPVAVPAGAVRLSPRIALVESGGEDGAEAILGALSETLASAQSQPGRRLLWADGRHAPRGRSAAAMETDLLAALDKDEIAIVFQPQFAIPGGRVTGAEALARWQHHRLGPLGAATLFAVAERADHTAQLSRHIAERALAAAAAWPSELRLSLNVTAADLAAGGFRQGLEEALARTGFPTARLTVEVTEQALLVDLESSAAMLAGLAAQGVRIALDDFGTGFSNFRYLKVLPLDYLKLDHSLTDEIVASPRDRAILRAIVAMARALELKVVAEGVESEAQLSVLAEEGCSSWQGFLGAGPLSGDEFAKFLAGSSPFGRA